MLWCEKEDDVLSSMCSAAFCFGQVLGAIALHGIAIENENVAKKNGDTFLLGMPVAF